MFHVKHFYLLNAHCCHAERSEESHSPLRFFAPLRMTMTIRLTMTGPSGPEIHYKQSRCDKHRMDEIHAEVVADFMIVRNRPERQFAAFAYLNAARCVVQRQGARAVYGGRR